MCVAVGALASAPASADPVDVQSFPAFGAIVDGQPCTPLHPAIATRVIADAERTRIAPLVAITPGQAGMLSHMLVGIALPGLEISDSQADRVDATTVFWQQRWVAQHGHLPTLSTLVSAGLDDAHALAAGGMLIGVYSVAPVVVYGSASYDTDRLLRGVVGLKLPPLGPVEFGLDVRDDTSGSRAIEGAAVVPIGTAVTVSPGVSYTNDDAAPITAGVYVAWVL